MDKGLFKGLQKGFAKGFYKGLQTGNSKGLYGPIKTAIYNEYLQRNSSQDEPLDIDYVFLLAVADAKGYSLPTSDGQLSGSRLIKRLKQKEYWFKIDCLYVFAGSGDSDFATLNWRHPSSFQATKVGAITYTTNQGFTGNGSSTYINTNFNLFSHSVQGLQNANSWVIGINSNPAGGSMQDFGVRRNTGTVTITSLYSRLATDVNSSRNNCIASDTVSVASTNSIGDYMGVRLSSSAHSLYKDGALQGTDSSSTSSGLAAGNFPVYVGCANNLGSAFEFSTRQITHWGWGNFGTKFSEWDTAWKEYFTSLGVAQSQPVQTVYNDLAWSRYANPIINGSKKVTSVDTCQTSLETIVDTGTHWYVYYLSSNPLELNDVDRVCLSIKRKDNDITTGWLKYPGDNNDPDVIFDVGGVGDFDEKQVHFRAVRKEGNRWKAWFTGQSALDVFKVGYATSNDGISWTRYSTSPIFEDSTLGSGTGITIFRLILDPTINKYRMIYGGNDLGENICLAESSDGINWTKTHSHLLDGRGLGWVVYFQLIDGYYYILADYSFRIFSNVSEYIKLLRTKDFTTWEDLGIQFEYRGAAEWGIAGPTEFFRKPNGQWAALGTGYKNQIGKNANFGEEFTYVWGADLATTQNIPIGSRRTEFIYPSYVTRFYPLAPKYFFGLDFQELIAGETGTINAAPVSFEFTLAYDRNLDFLVLDGTQTVTFPNNGSIINPSNFGVKMRILSTAITGTRRLFEIGGDIIMTLEAGNLQVILSADGVTETKKYISTADISKPTSMSYIDDHIYVGFTWIGGVLTLYNDFVPFTVTKTNDGALTNVNNSGANIELGKNTAITMRSVSILSNITDQQWIDLEI